MLVRLKPHNKRRGFVLRSYTFRGQRYVGERGWYEVSASLAADLAEIQQVDSDPHSPMAFDVATHAEAREIDALEATDEGKRSARDPDQSAMTTASSTPAGRRAAAAAKAAEAAAAEKDARIAELEAQLAEANSSDDAGDSNEEDEGDEGDGDDGLGDNPEPADGDPSEGEGESSDASQPDPFE